MGAGDLKKCQMFRDTFPRQLAPEIVMCAVFASKRLCTVASISESRDDLALHTKYIALPVSLLKWADQDKEPMIIQRLSRWAFNYIPPVHNIARTVEMWSLVFVLVPVLSKSWNSTFKSQFVFPTILCIQPHNSQQQFSDLQNRQNKPNFCYSFSRKYLFLSLQGTWPCLKI